MSNNVNNNFNNASFAISLNPPGSEGDPFSNNVTYIGGKPLGETPINYDSVINSVLGYTDTIVSAASEDGFTSSDIVKATLAGLNIGVQLAYNNMSPEQQVQFQLDNLDPSNPSAPIIMQYVKIADDSLKSGDLAGVSVQHVAQAQATDEIEKSEEPTSAGAVETTQVQAPKGNPWLGGNAYTQFVESYFELLIVLKKMKEIESKLELAGMAQVYDLAKQSADTIMAAAKERAMMHIMQAVMAGVTMGITLGLTALSVFQTSKFKLEEDGVKDLETGKISGPSMKDPVSKEQVPMTKSQAIQENRLLTSGSMGTQTILAYTQAAQSGGKAMDDVIQAIFEIRAAEYDALKEILQAYRTIAQHQMDRATEGFKSETDMIAQLLQQLDQIRQKLVEAISASLRHS